jgi:hypothetical protein
MNPSFVVRLLLGALVAFSPLGSTWGAEKISKAAAESQARLKSSVTYLASDELEGRGVGTEGLNKAADFIASEFKKLGLKTDLFDGTPFQKFEVTITTEMGPKEQNVLRLEGDETISLKLGEDFNPLAAGGSGKVDAPLVFVGYGITAKEAAKGLDYDEYAGLDVKGKVVVVIRKEPQQKNPHSKFDGDRPSRHATFMEKIANANNHGAAAVILVNDSLELQTAREQAEKIKKEAADKLAEENKKFAELKEPSEEQKKAHEEAVKKLEARIAEIEKELAAGFDKPLPFTGAGDESQQRKLPVFFARRELVDRIIKKSLGKSLDEIEAAIDADLKPQSAPLNGWKAVGETNLVQKKAEVKNVIAVLEGEGPLADETIVVGAHYDHLGFGGPGSLAPWTKEIHNGADDNASGTATLLEIAHLLATSGKKPQRRIVFMAFSAEERGLLGSQHYVREPRFPLDKTIAMFNLDMVGRLKNDLLLIDGVGTAKEFEPLVDKLVQEAGFTAKKSSFGSGRSDHESFFSKKIPVLHIWTDLHSDYHRPSDDSDKLNIAGMQRVADLVVQLVLATDASPTRPTFVEVRRAVVAMGGGDRPWLGSVPDFASNEEGLRITDVSAGSPAEKAGMKGGDIITKLGDSKISGVEDLQSALMKHKPGDKVIVVVKRDGKELSFEVTLTKRGR